MKDNYHYRKHNEKLKKLEDNIKLQKILRTSKYNFDIEITNEKNYIKVVNCLYKHNFFKNEEEYLNIKKKTEVYTIEIRLGKFTIVLYETSYYLFFSTSDITEVSVIKDILFLRKYKLNDLRN